MKFLSQVLIALCATSLAVAAPQLNLPGLRSVNTINANLHEEQVVSRVVTQLGPYISQAVADAIASLGVATVTEAVVSEEVASDGEQAKEESNARATLEEVSIAAQERVAAEQAARQRAAAEQTPRAGVADSVIPTARPVYNFEYKVADNDAQTYISQSEERDGESLTGTYSYVNPLGSLITVNYQAGPEGYSQTSSEQSGFVDIQAQPARSNTAAEKTAMIAALQVERFANEQRAAEEAARIADEQRAAEEAARLANEQKAAEEAAKIADEQRAVEEAARLAYEQRAAEEAVRLANEQKAAVEAAKIADEQRAAEEAARLANEEKAAEEAAKLADEQRALEEAARLDREEEAVRLAAVQREAEEAARLDAEQRATEEASRLKAEEAASRQSLISRIIASLQPQISSAVQNAISATRTVANVAPVARAAPVVATGDLPTTFGNGFSVKIDTPEYNVEY